jgi:hypothetical protein
MEGFRFLDEEYICEDLGWAAKIEARSLGFMRTAWLR